MMIILGVFIILFGLAVLIAGFALHKIGRDSERGWPHYERSHDGRFLLVSGIGGVAFGLLLLLRALLARACSF